MVAGMALVCASCMKDVQPSEEAVEVRFSASVPQKVMTRADAAADVVVCAVFHEGTEVAGSRKTIAVADGAIVYTPKLVKSQTYDIVFWAMSEGAYNVTDLTKVSRTAGKSEADYDAFTQSVEYTVDGTTPAAVVLKRPLAKINLGVGKDDWDAAVALGQTPAKAVVKVSKAYSGFNALTQEVAGTGAAQEFTFTVTGAEFTVANVAYKTLASNFMFTDGANISYEYKISAGNDASISTKTVSNVPVKKNYNTNIVGNLMTEDVSFNITIDEAYAGDNNQGI